MRPHDATGRKEQLSNKEEEKGRTAHAWTRALHAASAHMYPRPSLPRAK
jgi:hypothetical protein